MAKKYLTCAETAKLVRAALKEAFPDVKFSVRSMTYAGGASISVSWTDGPNSAQVEAITRVFETSYFDGMIDYQGSIMHMVDGEQVRFGADSIHTNRESSRASIERAISRVMRHFAADFHAAGFPSPTVEDYEQGRLMSWQLPGVHHYGGEDVQAEIRKVLHRHSDRLKVNKSKTAGKVIIMGDDGYSRQCGAGFSAVQVDV